ncbi:MAG: aminomethyl-transferring glycine dehydrogenase [Akkermansia sp.]|nr:aminomethyl-transferring glycine dehydrogenase [Akkermansia sp.]
MKTITAQTAFVPRHNGSVEADVQAMLKEIGFSSLDEMTDTIVPKNIRLAAPLNLPEPLAEQDALAKLREVLSANRPVHSLIGQGYYGAYMPAVIQRNVYENPGWYTAYTPYQPEIAQGRLEMLVNFQTMISDLTGLPIANASMLDEGTAAAEAVHLCISNKGKSDTFFVADTCFPQTIDVMKTRCETTGVKLIVGDWKTFDPASVPTLAGVLVQYPDNLGSVEDYAAFFEKCHACKVQCVVAADLLALTVLKEPGAFGADVAIGTTQRFGIPMGYGGPAAAYMACSDALKRKLPGRFIGLSVDKDGKPAYRLALQTREQHIRREKATSNICTAQVLTALLSTFYAMYQGHDGLVNVAMTAHRLAAAFAASLKGAYELPVANYFDTVTVRAAGKADALVAAALKAGYNIRRLDADTVSVSFDETTTSDDLAALCGAFGVAPAEVPASPVWDAAYTRTAGFCGQKCFTSFHTETEMMRYIHRLESKDLALNEAMIPLGSCTMKANCAAIMMPITWPEVTELHPFAPADQCQGMRAMLEQLKTWLAAVTGFDGVSLQPNSGAAGEFAGLLTIHRYQVAQGQGYRNVCLIPTSAHGTNPASSAMAGFTVVPVKCDDHGNIDPADLKAQAEAHRDNLAALMVTYPSTHGVYESTIAELCKIVHENGGQVYMDGANMNAQCGLTNPGTIGADVCHLNLHKTFAMPHGGGGPGVGPICCAKHLTPYLPGHVVDGAAQTQGAVSSAEYGSAGLNPISWMYLAMMGHEGLKLASQMAILNANYVAKRLAPYFPTLYSGANGLVAHECILDTRPMLEKSHLTVDDMAKRLMDYGFHAPTMSFPVHDTLMVEPTESESKYELDRFVEAMAGIHAEMTAVAEGKVPADDNVMANAPHTALTVSADEWTHPYTRRQAAYPAPGQLLHKFWPGCSRVDNTYGDRNFCCCCDTLAEAEK